MHLMFATFTRQQQNNTAALREATKLYRFFVRNGMVQLSEDD